jgi:hypothetical protein
MLRILNRISRTTTITTTFTRSFATARATSNANTDASTTPATNTNSSFILTTNSNVNTITPANTIAPPANIKTLRKELIRSLDADVTELINSQDEALLHYIKDNKFRIFHNDENNSIVVSRAVGDTFVEARFDLEPEQEEENVEDEEEQNENEQEHEQEQEQNEEVNEEETEEEDADFDRYNIQILISKVSKEGKLPEGAKYVPNTISIDSYVDSRGYFHVNSITTEVSTTSIPRDSLHPAVPQIHGENNQVQEQQMTDFGMGMEQYDTPMQFSELGDATKDNFLRYLEALGVDDQFGQFVQHYAQVVRTQGYVRHMNQLRQFLAQ